MILYYDTNGFHERQEDALLNSYVTDTEYQQQLFKELNSNHEINKNDVWRIMPDITGKPVIVEIELDMKFVFRRKRQEVFSVINRGPAWYNTLDEIQKEELQIWYQAWLDVTDTLEEPVKPSWLS